MVTLHLCVLTTILGVGLTSALPQTSYGLPYAPATASRYLQDFPVRTFAHPQAAAFGHSVPQPSTRQLPVFQSDSPGSDLELLPPLQHVVGTRYPPVDPGLGFRFPIAQLLNPTPPPNLLH